jgi:general secretion pathway protein D
MIAFIHRLVRIASHSFAAGLLPLLMVVGNAVAQPTVTPNYKDADIQQIIEAVGEITGKNFIIDPRVKAQVTMVSSTPMSADAFYEAFLSILQVYGFVAVPSGGVIKILPDANARQLPGWEGDASGSRRADDIVTQVVPVTNISAAQLVPILRPLIPQYGHLAAYPASNMLIISDRAANVDRIVSIIRRIDQASDDDYEVIRLTHASAAETVRVATALQQGAVTEGGGQPITVVADDRTNSILISGDKSERLRLRALITHLDTPLEEGGDTNVRYLRYANALDLATKLQTQYSGIAPSAASAEGGAPSPAAGVGGGGSTDITIWADEQTNALVITAPPKIMRNMMGVIDKIDIRRAQVLVEAVIVEVTENKAAELGISWAAYNEGNLVGLTKFSGVGPGVAGLADAIIGDDLTGVSDIINDGVNIGAGRISDSGTSFVGLIQALEADSDTNIVATPTLVMLDNEEAQIQIGQEVPFVTGSFTNTGGAGGAVNPFQTIEREQVGLTLKLTPQINEGDAVLLKIEQEISSVLPIPDAVDLITSNRTVATTVIVEDRGTLVIAGLLQDEVNGTEQRVPILGSIPVIGPLFRSNKDSNKKTNLMVFIKPTIIRDSVASAYETNQKYTYIRDLQLKSRDKSRRLIEDFEAPVIPPLPTPPAAESPIVDLRELAPETSIDSSRMETTTPGLPVQDTNN